MKRAWLVMFLVCGLCGSVHAAATKTLTLGGNLKFWFTSTTKDFKQIKTKTTLISVPIYTRRMLDSLNVTGLETGGTVFPTLDANLQTALTRLNTDLQNMRTKNSNFQKLINAVVGDLGNIAGGTTPGSIATAQNLYEVMYAAAGDGEFNDKEKQTVTDALTDFLASTPSLAAATVTNLQGDVTTMLAGVGVTKTDLDLITADLKSIGDLIKSIK